MQHTKVISIHAPVKGATYEEEHECIECDYFNPRTREGCDRQAIAHSTQAADFNPRTREGCDVYNDNDI